MNVALPALLTLAVSSIAFAQEKAPEPEPRTLKGSEATPSGPALVVVPRLSVFSADVRGRVRADEASAPAPILDGTSVNFESDLDLDDADPVWILEIAAFHRGEGRYLERASLSYLDASYEGSATLDSTEDFNGRTFPAGTAVDSKFRYRAWGADFAIVDGETLFENTSASFLMGLRYTDLRIEMDGGGQETDERLRLFWIGLGFRGERSFGPRFSGVLQAAVYFSFGGYEDVFDLQFEEWGGAMFEGMAGMSASFGPVQLEAGWRLISQSTYSQVDTTDKFEDNDFSLQLGGPWFSATLRF